MSFMPIFNLSHKSHGQKQWSFQNPGRPKTIVIFLFLFSLCSCGWRNLDSYFSDSIVISDGRHVWTVDISAGGCRLSNKLYQNKLNLLQPTYGPVLKKILVPTRELGCQEPQPLHGLELSGSVQRVILPMKGDLLTWPSVSPNGKYVAFLLPSGNMRRKLIIISSDGSSVLYIGDKQNGLGGPHYPYGHRPAWLPDSSGVICDTSLDKEYLVLFRFSDDGSTNIKRLGEGFAPAVSSNGAIAFYLREGPLIKVCTGLLNMNSLTIENVKVQYKSKRIMDHISPAWSRQNPAFLFFLKDWVLALYEAQKLLLLDSPSGRVFCPDKKGVLKYRMFFGFDTLPKGYTTRTSASE